MKRRMIVICAVVACFSLVAIVHRDLSLKRASRAAIINLCTNERLDKLGADGALDKLEQTVKGVTFLSVNQEEQAAALVNSFIFSFKLRQDSVDRAQEHLLDADSDYAKHAWREDVSKAELALAEERRLFAEKMKIVLSAY